MKIYTNENNSVALKILISAEFVNKTIPVEIVHVHDKRFQGPRRLPVLELDSGAKLFSSNTASSFVYKLLGQVSQEDENWLSWEATNLQPNLIQFLNKPESKTLIIDILSEMESALSSSKFLTGAQTTVADICIWATLYPIYTEDSLKNQFLKPMNNIFKWFELLHADKCFQAGVSRFSGKKGLQALTSVASACWYPSAEIVPASASLPGALSSSQEVTAVSDEEVRLALQSWEKGPSSWVQLKPPIKPVLPVEGEKNILITSALPYVNNVPHLGNIIGCVLSADVFARYCRARGFNTLYICGTDEYGTATETKALEEHLSPQEICDKYFAIHRDIYSWFNISFDHFGRTTTAQQREVVHSIFKECHNNGFTSTAEMDQLFCEKCDRFLADRFVEGTCPDCKYEDARGDQCDSCGHLINAVDLIKPRCKQCQNTPIIRQSQQLFLELPKVESWLSYWVEKASEGWSSNAKVITKSWLSKGLKPRCITRDLKWGVPVPLEGFEDKVFYVWFDAPIGYMSITKIYTEYWKNWWKKEDKYNVTLYQFMAKDNVPFHSIMFPASIYASKQNYNLVNHLMATEYLNYEDGKFSKSRGVGVFGNDAKDTGIPSDIFRFYLLYIRPESQDSNFSWADFAMKVNSELLNNLGNFINRGLMFVDKFYGGSVPPIELLDEELKLLALIRQELRGFLSALDKAKLRDGIKYILNISRHGNLYIQSNKPWELVRGSDDEKTRAGTVVGMSCNMVGLLASLLQPYMPETVATISKQVNLPLEYFGIQEQFCPYFGTGHKIGKPFPLFAKIEQATADSLKEKYAGQQKPQAPVMHTSSMKPNIPVRFSNESQYKTAIKSLEEAVLKQGDIVRQMKTDKKSKDELKPMIDTLLDLKKQLADLKADYESRQKGDNQLTQLIEEISAQGEKVRKMKESGVEKSVWQPEVTVLLDLKKKLAEAEGAPPPSASSRKKKKNKK